MLCHAAEHLIHTFVPPRPIPTPDSVVYNDSIFSRYLQGNHIHTSLVACTNPSSPLTTYQKHLLLHLLFPVLTYSLGSITRFIPICLHKPFILTPLSKAKRRYNIAPFHLGYPECKKGGCMISQSCDTLHNNRQFCTGNCTCRVKLIVFLTGHDA